MNFSIISLAGRLFFSSSREKSVSSMMIIAMLSIFIGSFALALITAIMNGFETAVHQKLQGIHADIIIESPGESLDQEAIRAVIKSEFPEITALSGRSLGYILLPPLRDHDMPQIIALQAIDPAYEKEVTHLAEKIITPHSSLSTVTHNKVIIGKGLAQSQGIECENSLQIFYAESFNQISSRIMLEEHTIECAALFNTGIDEFDNNTIFCSQELFSSLFPEQGTTQLIGRVADKKKLASLIPALAERLKLEVYSWHDLYPAIVSALKLEKYALFFILALVTLAGCMNIISLIFMLITRKRPEIAILLALGASPTDIFYLFVGFALLVGVISAAAGIALAMLCSAFLNWYPCIQLPDVYYVSHLPSHMTWEIAAGVFVCIVSMCVGASLIPLRKLRTLSIARVLRFEG